MKKENLFISIELNQYPSLVKDLADGNIEVEPRLRKIAQRNNLSIEELDNALLAGCVRKID